MKERAEGRQRSLSYLLLFSFRESLRKITSLTSYILYTEKKVAHALLEVTSLDFVLKKLISYIFL